MSFLSASKLKNGPSPQSFFFLQPPPDDSGKGRRRCPEVPASAPPQGNQLIISLQSWALSVFFIFFNNKKKLFVAFFSKLIWLGVGFLNKIGAETGY